MAALSDIMVLDFSTLLPGPMATLMLADAGADIIKVERPVTGDEMRSYQPNLNGEGINFAMLNRGKKSLAIDLKDPSAKAVLRPLLEKADVIIEQFRPGVMARLGLSYDDVKAINPDIIYCSITAWGSYGPKSKVAAHDLNFLAETGVLGLTTGVDGSPVLPPALIGDIAGGTYPALINILLALRERDRTGTGCWIDVSMGENLFPFLYWALGNGQALNEWPKANGEIVTGGTPRYQIYRTKDDLFIAAAPLEDKFWANFTSIIGLDKSLVNDSIDPTATTAAIRQIIASRTSKEWVALFHGQDVCCSLVARLEDSFDDPHWKERQVFSRKLNIGGKTVAALPSIVAAPLRATQVKDVAPKLGSK